MIDATTVKTLEDALLGLGELTAQVVAPGAGDAIAGAVALAKIAEPLVAQLVVQVQNLVNGTEPTEAEHQAALDAIDAAAGHAEALRAHIAAIVAPA